jgi:hypothetical protein
VVGSQCALLSPENFMAKKLAGYAVLRSNRCGDQDNSIASNRPSCRCHRFLVVRVAMWEHTVSAAGGRVLLSSVDGFEQTTFHTTQSAMWKYLRA